ncbi:MAG TPA: hypothetical protein VM120_29120 [Bryobacteraceae bacterium]|nr:hypothetical protein [Bryobacteraceae bacterium]
MATLPLTGFKFSADKIPQVKPAKEVAAAAENAAKDAEWAQKLAEDKAESLLPAGLGPDACRVAAEEARQQAAAAKKTIEGPPVLAGKAARPYNAIVKKAEANAERLEALAAKKPDECQDALEAAQKEALEKKAEAEALREKAKELAATAARLEEEAKLLDKVWAKDQTANPDIRKQEADWRTMKDDLDKLGAKSPPGAVAYCKALEKSIDDKAHKAHCERCDADHGIPRPDNAKALVTKLIADLERLAKLPTDEGLTTQEKQIRAVGLYVERLRNSKVKTDPKGKMIGVLICDDGTVIMGFSGDVDGNDDMPGFAVHVPPADQGGEFLTANKVKVPLVDLPEIEDGNPHGVCAAPKMIQAAYKAGKKPAAMAEAWYGKDAAQPHGALVASCKTCVSNLDVQLCDHYPAPKTD